MRKWITCTIMAVMMAAMIFMGTGNNVFANDEVTYDSNMQTKKFDVDVKVGEDGSNREYQSQVCQSEAWNLSLYPIQREGDNKR